MDLQYVFKEQAKNISKIKSAMSEQLRQTDCVIASQKAVGEVFREVSERLGENSSRGFSAMSGVLQELCYINENGFREISDRLDLQNEKLSEIREILKRPLDTQAKELRARAEKAYLNNWIDEAESDLLEAEKKNYQDFFVHSILGNIYFFYKKNYPEALKYYGKAAKYALPVSKEFASKAYMSMGMTHFETKAPQDAYLSSQQAFNINPEDEDVCYTHAIFSANAGHMGEFIGCLHTSICKDPRYLILAGTDSRLSFCRDDVHQLARTLRDGEKQKIQNLKAELESAKRELSLIGIEDLPRDIEKCITEVNRLVFADNYIDCLTARILASNKSSDVADKTEKGKEALSILDKARSIFSFLASEDYKEANRFGLFALDLAPVSEILKKADALQSQKTHPALMQAASAVTEAMKRFYYKHSQKLRSGIASLQSEMSRTQGKGFGCFAWFVALAIFFGGISWTASHSGSFGTFLIFLVLSVVSLYAIPAVLRNACRANLEADISEQKGKVTEVATLFKQFE